MQERITPFASCNDKHRTSVGSNKHVSKRNHFYDIQQGYTASSNVEGHFRFVRDATAARMTGWALTIGALAAVAAGDHKQHTSHTKHAIFWVC
jgi:hypothetical protein